MMEMEIGRTGNHDAVEHHGVGGLIPGHEPICVPFVSQKLEKPHSSLDASDLTQEDGDQQCSLHAYAPVSRNSFSPEPIPFLLTWPIVIKKPHLV